MFLALLAGCIPSTNRIAPTPSNVVATGEVEVIILTWASSMGANGYNVKRGSTVEGPYTQVAFTATPSYTDSTVSGGTTYYYVVSAVAPGGESGYSEPVAAALVVTPLAPQNLGGTAGDGQVQLVWSDVATATRYHVKRATVSGGPYTQIATPTATSYLDTSTTNGVPYYYVVTAVNAAGESAPSTQVRVTPNIQNPPPTTFGTWTNVTPSGVDLTSDLCSNYGTSSVQVDPLRTSDLYTMFHCQGIWKSTDYGSTWTGPINTGTNGHLINECSGGITSAPGSSPGTPVLYAACIRGGATGFWKSTDGGVSWQNRPIQPTERQDYYAPVVNPYDGNHLLMAAHEFDAILESTDGGETWVAANVESAMLQQILSPSIFFINTGSAATTRNTWLYIGDQTGGSVGTWRTTNGGASWTQVDKNEHVGPVQIYQPDTSGVIYMAGAYSASGAGVLRSADFGQTWEHVGMFAEQTFVFGSAKNVYSMLGYAIDGGGSMDPRFQVAAQPGTGTWVLPGTPAALRHGPAQVATVNDGTNTIFVGAMWNSGIWRYVEP